EWTTAALGTREISHTRGRVGRGGRALRPPPGVGFGGGRRPPPNPTLGCFEISESLRGDETMTIDIDTIPSRKNSTKLAVLRQQMRSAIASWVEFATPEWDRFSRLFHLRWVQGGDHFLLPAPSLTRLCFVCGGPLRACYLADNGTEAKKAFIADHEFAGPLPTAALGRPMICGIQALEPTTLLVAQYADFAALLEEHPVFGQFQSKLTAWLL